MGLNKVEISRKQALWMTGLAIIVIAVLWNVAALDGLLYPFRLFVTYVHEAGHGVAALITGGRLISFEVFPNGSGVTHTAGGWRWLILPAGYLGAALFGSVLFYLIHALNRPRLLATVIGVGLIVFSVLFGYNAWLSLIVGAVFGFGLLALAHYAGAALITFVLNVLALLTGLNAVLDLYTLVNITGVTYDMSRARNDALAFSQEILPLIPPVAWAFLWALLAVAMLGFAVWQVAKRHLTAI